MICETCRGDIQSYIKACSQVSQRVLPRQRLAQQIVTETFIYSSWRLHFSHASFTSQLILSPSVEVNPGLEQWEIASKAASVVNRTTESECSCEDSSELFIKVNQLHPDRFQSSSLAWKTPARPTSLTDSSTRSATTSSQPTAAGCSARRLIKD